ncbi:uncharacterized protein LOC144664059 [Oculina patagonica]
MFPPQSTEGAGVCKSALGMQSKGIPNANISASSTLSTNHTPAFARLDERRGAWCSAPNDNSPYVQILLDEEKLITKVVTQGSYNDLIWATKYQIKYLKEGKWSSYQKADGSLTLEGNTNVRALKEHDLQPPIRTHSIRIYPMVPLSVMPNEYNVVCLRLELFGCSVISCGDPGTPVNGEQANVKIGYIYSGSVEFTCKDNYTLLGANTIYCEETKNWSSPLPRCLAPCPDPGVPSNGRRIGDDFRHGKSVTFKCQDEFELKGMATINCNDGTWTDDIPQCKDISYASCRDIYRSGKSRGNTAYMLRTDVGKVPVYCHMTSIGTCGSGGWTLVMKIDGHKSTFHYDSNLWSNKNEFNRPGGTTGFDNVETKLPTYWSAPFSKICLAMKIGHQIRPIVINRQANSLYSLVADGHYRSTTLGRDTWKSLIGSQASLQRNCNKEGFNALPGHSHHSKARIGIIANQENDCITCDSRIGFGTGGVHDDSNTCGNEARVAPDNGYKHIKAMGYILVQ